MTTPIYPLRYVPPRPGPRPPRWQVRARRRWQRTIDARNTAKAWNFGALYGARVTELSTTPEAPTPQRVLCEAKRDCDPIDHARWIGWVRVGRVEGKRIWFKPPDMRALRGDHVGRFPGRYWHFRLRPETMCDDSHTQTPKDGVR